MGIYIRYPKIPYLPWSGMPKKLEKEDLQINETTAFTRMTNVVITEKLDGECTTLYKNYLHARSINQSDHPSRDWMKGYHAKFKDNIPENYRIVGENMYAKHSILYNRLTTYFYVFAVFDGFKCLSWYETVEFCKKLNLTMVPVLYIGDWSIENVKKIHDTVYTGMSKFSTMKGHQEGYVVRNIGGWSINEHFLNIAKYVRADHVQTGDHWMYSPLVKNKLYTENEPLLLPPPGGFETKDQAREWLSNHFGLGHNPYGPERFLG